MNDMQLYLMELRRVQEICRRNNLPEDGNLDELWDRLIKKKKEENKKEQNK